MKDEPRLVKNDPTGFRTLQIISGARHFNKWMYQTIHPYLKGNVLEIGSGIGNISAFAINDGFTITLSDYNDEYCSFLENKYSHHPAVKDIIRIDLQHPHFAKTHPSLQEKFDTVYLLNVIEHLENDEAAISNCRFMLKQGGNLVILVPAYPFLYCRLDRELGHLRRYTLKSLTELFAVDKFKVIHRQYFNFFGLAGWFVFGKLLGKKLIGQGSMSVYERLIPFLKITDMLMFRKAGLSVVVAGKKI